MLVVCFESIAHEKSRAFLCTGSAEIFRRRKVMSERTALPIGSVVRVREGVEPVMIVNHCPVTEKDGKQGYFDFGAVSLPLGLMNQNIIFFNKRRI